MNVRALLAFFIALSAYSSAAIPLPHIIQGDAQILVDEKNLYIHANDGTVPAWDRLLFRGCFDSKKEIQALALVAVDTLGAESSPIPLRI